MRLAILFIILSLTIGCGQPKNEKAPQKQPPKKEKSSISIMVDGATGKTAVKAGKHAKSEIERISKQHNNELNEILGE